MSINISGGISAKGTFAIEGEQISLPQGTILVNEYDATLGTLPTSQGWSGSTSGSSIIVDFDNESTLSKQTVSGLAIYSGAALDPGWLVELSIRVDSHNGNVNVHYFTIETGQSDIAHAFDFYPDKIVIYDDTTPRLVYEYDFKSNYVDVILLHNTDSGFVEMYLDGVRYRDDISEVYGFNLTRTLWGDNASSNGSGDIAYWRSIKTYNGWTI